MIVLFSEKKLHVYFFFKSDLFSRWEAVKIFCGKIETWISRVFFIVHCRVWALQKGLNKLSFYLVLDVKRRTAWQIWALETSKPDLKALYPTFLNELKAAHCKARRDFVRIVIYASSSIERYIACYSSKNQHIGFLRCFDFCRNFSSFFDIPKITQNSRRYIFKLRILFSKFIFQNTFYWKKIICFYKI